MNNEYLKILEKFEGISSSQHTLAMHVLLQESLKVIVKKFKLNAKFEKVMERYLLSESELFELKTQARRSIEELFKLLEINVNVNHYKNPDVEEMQGEFPAYIGECLKRNCDLSDREVLVIFNEAFEKYLKQGFQLPSYYNLNSR